MSNYRIKNKTMRNNYMRKKFLVLIGLMALSALIPAGSVQAEPESLGVAYNLVITHPHTIEIYDWVLTDFQDWWATEYSGDTVTVTGDAQASSFLGPAKIAGWNGSSVTSDILWGGGSTEFDKLVDNPGLNLLQRYRVADHNNYSEFLSQWPMWDSSAVNCGVSTCDTDPSWYLDSVLYIIMKGLQA
jgi:hypothetical protein